MSYQQGYVQGDYGGYQGYDQTSSAQLYQTNQSQYPPRHHPMVVVPPQPRQDVSQYCTPPQSFQPQHQAVYHQQYPSQYEQATQQQYYYPQLQQYYPSTAPQAPFQFHNLEGQMSDQYSSSHPSYQQGQTMNPQDMYSGGYASSHPQSQQHIPQRQQVQAPPQLPSSPDPLQTPQYQVQARPAQQSSRSQGQAPKPQQRVQPSSRQSMSSQPASNSSQRVTARVDVPVQQGNAYHVQPNMEPSLKRRRSNEGQAIPVCQPSVSQNRSFQQHSDQQAVASSPLTELPSSQMPPTPEPNVDHRAVLLALAEEYLAAAYSMSTSLATSDDSEERYEEYHALMSTAMGCLESALVNFKQPDFRTEARLRLRLASLMVEETRNDQEAEEMLSKGVALCERSRLTDLKYAMHHLLIRVMFKTRPKAALKAIDKLVQEVETLGLAHWMYAFRFMRVSLSLQVNIQSETSAVLKHLASIVEAAEESRHVAVQIIAAVLATVVHIRSGKPDAVELAQRAMASARTHQLGPEMEQLPQIRALLDCLDVACCFIQSDPEQLATKVQRMQNNLDAATRAAGWHKDGSIVIQMAPTKNSELEKDTCGIMRRTKDGNASLVFRWLTKSQLYALGYLLSGMANLYKTNGISHAEKYFEEARKLAVHAPDAVSQSLVAALNSASEMEAIRAAIRVHSIFTHCMKYEWSAGMEAIKDMREEYSQNRSDVEECTIRTLLYLEALCRHGLGELGAAYRLYSSPSLVFQPEGKAKIVDKDLRILAALNKVFIMRSQGFLEGVEAENLLHSIEPHCTSNMSKGIKAVYYIIRATMQGSNNAIVKTKQYLQAAVDASKSASNNQLLSICMNVMTATFFANIVGEQAEKSARTGRSLARRSQDRLWTLVADGMYGDIMERCGKAAEAEAARQEAKNLMAGLPQSLKNSLQESRDHVAND